MRLHRFVLCLIAGLFVIGLCLGQAPTGTISGLILDPDGRVIPDADILVVNDVTGVQYSTKTNNDGLYVISNLPPGPYRLQVSKIGFKALIKPNIVLNVQDALAINFTLPIGAASEVVTVQGGASTPLDLIRWWAAAQLEWQSSSAPMMPPFSTPSNAS